MMTGRILMLIKQFGSYASMDDVYRIYDFINDNVEDIEELSNEELIAILHNTTKYDGHYNWDVFRGTGE